MKKLNAFILSLVMMICMMPSAAFSQSAEESGEFVISDFSQSEYFELWSGENMSREVVEHRGFSTDAALLESFWYPEKSGIDKYGAYDSKFTVAGSDIPSDWTNTGYINMWIYSPEVNDEAQISLIILTQDGSYFKYNKIKPDFEGWKLISVPKASFEKRHSYTNWNNVKTILFATYEWDAKHVPQTKLYFKKIWASAAEPGTANAVSMSHEDGRTDVEASDNVIYYELEEAVEESLSEAKITVNVISGDGEIEILPEDAFEVSYSGGTVSLTFVDELKKRKEYKISISGVYTVADKSFSIQNSFFTEGYKPQCIDPTLFEISDFSEEGTAAKWSSTNMSEYSEPLGNYDKMTALIETFCDESKPEADRYKPYWTQFKLAENSIRSDWSDVEAVNMWVYSPEANDTAKICVLLMSGSSYFQYPIAVDFEGWKLISIKKSEFEAKGKNASWESIDRMDFVTYGWAAVPVVGTKLYFKDIWVSGAGEGKLIENTIKNNEADVCMNETGMSIGYDSFICDTPYFINAVLKKFDGETWNEEGNPTVEIQNGRIIFKNQAPYEPDTKYKLEIENLYLKNGNEGITSIEFQTSSEEIQALHPVIKEETATGNVSVNTTVYNTSDKDIQVEMAVRLLNKNGDIVAEKRSSITNVDAQSEADVFVQTEDIYTLLKEFSGEAEYEYTVEAFIVNKTDNNKPVLRHIGKYPDSDLSYEEAVLENAKVNVSSKIRDTNLIISGSVEKSGVRPVVITVSDEDGKEKLFVYTYTGEDGSFELTQKLDDVIDKSGSYSVKAAAYRSIISDESINTFYYADEELKQSLCEEINKAKKAGEIAKLINEYQAALGLAADDYSNMEKYSNMMTTLFEQIPYNKFAEIGEIIDLAESLLCELNEKSWTDIADFVTKNKKIIIAEVDFESTFFKKTESVKNGICRKVSEYGPFEAFADFRTALENAIDEYNEENKKTSVSSGGGGGGKSKGVSTRTFQTTPVKEEPKPENIGFDDLNDYGWAKNDINNLLTKGVISMSTDKKFRPADAVKREEFVKMIVEAFDIPMSGQSSGFSDSTEDAWYEKYLAAAKESKIVFGREDNSFGAGELIKREDMAVMICRAIEALKLNIPANVPNADFSDEAQISDYAADAVEKMQKAGFINGVGNDMFDPCGNATRAQAAVIINRVMTAFEKGAVKQ